MGWLDLLRAGTDALRSHRLRSALTVVGIMIGIAAVILTVGLGEGAQNQVRSAINSLGTNLLSIGPGSTTSTSGVRQGFGSASTLTVADADALSSPTVAPDIKTVAPVMSASEVLVNPSSSSTWTTTLQATSPAWLEARNRQVAQGRFINAQDLSQLGAVAVLAPETASELFGGRSPVGQTVEVNGVPLTVVGVLQAVGGTQSSTGTNQDDQVIVPLTTAQQRILTTPNLSAILVQAKSSSALSAAYQEADDELLALHQITTPADADFTIASEQSLVSTATSVDHTLTVLLGSVAAISLLVGGIGVMNIMLVSVTERVREIGLRKALGAAPSVIRRQFLLEASILGLAGGAIGALLALVGTHVLPGPIGYPITLSPTATVVSILVAIAIGVVFGVYPASRAARLTPIDALRTE